MKLNEDSKYTLSTGKVVYVHMGLLSTRKSHGRWQLFGGYDNDIQLTEWNEGEIPEFTKEELLEIANYQINLWMEFLNDVAYGKVPILEGK